MKSALRAELAELYERADQAIQEARKLREEYRFIVHWLTTQAARSAHRTSLSLNEDADLAQRAAVRLDDAELAALLRSAIAMGLAQVNPVHSA